MSFHVGQKVVCVRRERGLGAPEQPVVGVTYTVRAIQAELGFGEPGLLLEEITNPISPFEGIEFDFFVSRFRPLIENKSSVSFTMGADPESERWDNRIKIPAKAVSHQH